MLGLGFSSGIPFLLVYITQSAWLSEARVPIGILGLMSEIDAGLQIQVFMGALSRPVRRTNFQPPARAARAGWIVLSQIGVMATLAGIAFGDPANWLSWTILFSLALGFAGATQDVVIDGWRITVAPKERQALMSSWAEVGWRIGNLVAGAGALYLSDAVGWRAAYLCMVLCMAPGIVGQHFSRPNRNPISQKHHKPASFVATVTEPIKDLMKRLGPMAIPILIMVAGFRMPGYISNAMAFPLFKALHYSNSDIATVTKLFGFWVALAGTFAAGYLVPRIGMMASLVTGTIFASASHLSLAYLAVHGDHARRRVLAVCSHGEHRQSRLCFRIDCAHHLYVDANLNRTCSQPIRAADIAMRIPRQHPRGLLWLFDRTDEFRVVLCDDVADRRAGRDPRLVSLARRPQSDDYAARG